MNGTELTREKMRRAVMYLDRAPQRSLTYGDIHPRLVQYLFERAAAEQVHNQRRENDPMNITIHLREISNGVIVSTDQPEGYGISRAVGGEQFFASWEIAMSELPGIAAEARERAGRPNNIREAIAEKMAAGRQYAVPADDRKTWLQNDIGTERLPEEAAALGEYDKSEDDGGQASIVDGPRGPEFAAGYVSPAPDLDRLGLGDAEERN